jgi:hypothetical protein
MGRDVERRIHVRCTEGDRACAVATSDAAKINPTSVHVCFNFETKFLLQLSFSMNSEHIWFFPFFIHFNFFSFIGYGG